MQGSTILIIDDEPAILHWLASALSQMGYEVYTAASGPEGLRQFYTLRPDLIILDLMMPDVDGWTVCERIRQVSAVPLIMLTALSQEELIIRGLDYGADDYLTKPCSLELLLARVRAVLRRAALPPTAQKSVSYSDNRLTVDLDERRVFILGEPVKLSATEYGLLTYLFQNAGQVLTFEQILEQVWGETGHGNIDYVHVYVSRLRRKLEVNPKEPVYLVTEYGVGYRFEKQPNSQPKKG